MPVEMFIKAQKRISLGVANVMGMTELAGLTMYINHCPENGSVGKPISGYKYKLVDPEKGTEVGIRRIGELWIKGPAMFKGYLKNPTATNEALTEDGWFRTGDLMYKDDAEYYYYVERLKLMLKCMNQQATNLDEVNHSISPTEIEWVILQLEGVADVVVTSVDSTTGEGDLPVAAVVRKNGYQVTAEQIKQHVKDNLPLIKQLRGGVVFLDSLPLLRTTKVDRRKIKLIVSTSELE